MPQRRTSGKSDSAESKSESESESQWQSQRQSRKVPSISITAQQSQVLYLLLLLLKFKVRRLPMAIIALALLPSNMWLMVAYSNEPLQTPFKKDTQINNAYSFSTTRELLVDSSIVNAAEIVANMKYIMKERGASMKDSWLKQCNGFFECRTEFSRELFAGSTSAMFGFLSYNTSTLDYWLECVNLPDTYLTCSFLYQLVVQALPYPNNSASNKAVFHNVQFVQFYGTSESLDNVFVAELDKYISDSVCRQAILNGDMLTPLWLTVLFHGVFATSGYIMYLMATTVAFITGLKQNGFLQWMFSSGLSVFGYWFIMIFVTALEAVIFGAIFALCYHLQCPDVFTSDAINKLIFIMCLYFYSHGIISLLSTVLFRSYFTIVVTAAVNGMVHLAMSSVGVQRLSRSVLNDPKDEVLLGMLILPTGNAVQYNIYLLQSEKLRPWSKNQKDYLNSAYIGIIIFPFVLMVLMFYMDFILPSGNGFQLPPWYPFSPRFWLSGRDQVSNMVKIQDTLPEDMNYIEQVVNGVPAILVNDINVTYTYNTCKDCRYGRRKMNALNSFSCTIYENQITALIGHNGAGKTTLIRVLSGEEASTGGLAVIEGRTVTDPFQRLTLQRWVSICKQVDVLSRYLTVAESIKLAVLSKGLTMESQQERIDHMLEQLGLSDKKDTMAMDMSGGQLRKVCCIIAMLGDPAVVMLDEPTSGLDPVSRRRLWQILQDFKPGRCILLCTQFMDEADILADRKLFLSGGKLICAGSSLFLKHLFGCSTTINVSLKPEKNAGKTAGMSVDLLTNILKKIHPDVELISQKETELKLQVASSAHELRLVGTIIHELEIHKEWIDSFGVSQAILDDIFMQLGNQKVDDMKSTLKSGRQLSSLLTDFQPKQMVLPLRHPSLCFEIDENQTTGELHQSSLRIFSALMVLNLRRQVRAPLRFMCRFLMPLAMIAMAGCLVILQKDRYLNWKREAQTESQQVAQQVDASMSRKVGKQYEAVRSPVLLFDHVSGAICVSDEDDAKITDVSCWSTVKNRGNPNAVALTKSKSANIEDVLASNKDRITPICQLGCSFVYSSIWDGKNLNWNRSLVIGQYGRYFPLTEMHNPSHEIFKRILASLNSESHNKVRINTINPLRNFRIEGFEIITFLIVYSVIPVTFMSDTIEDKANRVRQHMYVMSLSSTAYWMNTFIVHWIQYFVFVLIALLTCLLWDRFHSLLFYCAVGLPLLFLGTVSNLLTVYCIGSLQQTVNYSVTSTYFFTVILINILPSVMIKSRLAYALCIWFVPPLAPVLLTTGSLRIFIYGLLYFETDFIDSIPGMFNAYLRSSDTHHALVAMPVHIILQAVFLHVSENWEYYSRKVHLLLVKDAREPRKTDVTAPQIVDSGVSKEKERVEHNPRGDTNLLEIRRLEKVHANGVKAVRGVSFGARQGEILGLLGQNGAGKTTLISVIVGELSATGSEVEVQHRGTWMHSLIGTRQGAIGYCPQHNPLFSRITVEEHLYFYAHIRGLPPSLIQDQIEGLIDSLGLGPHRAKASKHLSGGNKRRLCLAIALLGSPSVIVIDEASTGVDPENKRGIWRAIRGMTMDIKRTVVITTHSMEEVEALCDRVCIMHKGRMIGFDTLQKLRSRLGKAYILQALFHSKPDNIEKLLKRKNNLEVEILKHFEGSRVFNDVGSSIQFQLPIEFIPRLSVVYRWLAENQAKLGVQYFSMHQMSLDQTVTNMMIQCELESEKAEDKSQA